MSTSGSVAMVLSTALHTQVLNSGPTLRAVGEKYRVSTEAICPCHLGAPADSHSSSPGTESCHGRPSLMAMLPDRPLRGSFND